MSGAKKSPAEAGLSLQEEPSNVTFTIDGYGTSAADCTRVDPAKATPAEMRGQEVFFGKGQCASCHQPPYYTDNSMHDLKTERFFKPEMVNGAMMVGDGKIKTFPLRGIKDNPLYLHDQRLLTLDDTVEFFNLVLSVKLTAQEKQDLVAFMRAL